MTRTASVTAAILAGLAAVAATGYHRLVRRPRPVVQGELRLSGLRGRVEVVRDRWGIPHIFAEHEDDLFFAQGFVHAQDRLWQMDFHRRFASGRLSEVVGEATVETDRWARVLGLRRSAEAAWPHTAVEARRMATCYAAGVNAVIDASVERGNWPLEFRLLRYRPERWTPVDSLALLRLMALGLSVNFEAELVRERLAALLGPERAAETVAAYPPASPLIEGSGLDALRRLVPAGQGSNSWVLAGRRTMSGAPILANDPHLTLGLPAIWYENHLAGPQTRVAGASIAGLPGVVIGHNEEVAWGLTAGFSDVQDLYVETRHPEEPARFRWGDHWLPAEVIEERILVRGRSRPLVQRVTATRHGPLVSDLLPGESRDLALRWTIYEPDNTLGALLEINRAASCEGVRAAAADLGAPQLNVSYADRAGNIGWIHAGRIPIRQSADRLRARLAGASSPDGPSTSDLQSAEAFAGDLRPSTGAGLVPADGAGAGQEWLGYIPLDELPQVYNPAAGYIVHANNKPVGDDYPHWLGLDFLPGFRARRIVDLIEARAAHDLESTAAIQQDLLSIPARKVARAVAGLPPASLDPDLRPLQARLVAWDGRMAPESVEAALAYLILLRLRHFLLGDKLGPLAAAAQGAGERQYLTGLSVLAWTSLAWTLERLDDPGSAWWQQRGLPDSPSPRDDALRLALRAVADDLESRFGPNPESWQWGRLNQVVVGHPLAGGGKPGRSPLARLLSRGPFPMGGDPFTVWPNALQAEAVRADMAAVSASWRFLADLSDWDRCRTALPGGQSGLPGASHYADGLEDWRAGRYHPLLWTRPAIEAAAAARLILQPAKESEGVD